MEIVVKRIYDNGEATAGILYIDGVVMAVTLEDQFRPVKVKGDTRIPAGEYPIVFRTEGRHHSIYSKKFKSIHKGMLHIINVPNFTYILIHIGNYEKDTEGCLLVGDNFNYKGYITNSTDAYTRIYPVIANALSKGEKVVIKFIDDDR